MSGTKCKMAEIKEIIISKQGLVMPIDEWCELLNTYTTDDLCELYFDTFNQDARRKLNPYFAGRLKHLRK